MNNFNKGKEQNTPAEKNRENPGESKMQEEQI